MTVSITYNPLLVLLSIAVAIQASYVGLRVTIQVADARGVRRRIFLVGASLSLASGIWGMHFVGMLAAELPVGTAYQVLPTLISFLLCVLVVGFALVGATSWPKTEGMLAGTATVMGLGIATMHYVGMMALHDSLHMVHDPPFVVASIVVAIVASAAALWLATREKRRPSIMLCAIVLGLAISSMHFVAMAGTTIKGMTGMAAAADPSLSSGLMAIVVAMVAFIISAGFFLTLVPEPRAAPALAVSPKSRPEPAPAPAEPPQPVVSASPPTPAIAPPEKAAGLPEGGPKLVPVERDGTRVMIAPDEICAVRANAHYCSIYTGREELFCSLSISEVESYLRGGSFARVHRSHIVNLDRVVTVRKTADGGFAEMAGGQRLSVPISRARINAIREHIQGRDTASPRRSVG